MSKLKQSYAELSDGKHIGWCQINIMSDSMGQGLVYAVQRYGDLYSNTSVVLMVDNQAALQIPVPWARVPYPSIKV